MNNFCSAALFFWDTIEKTYEEGETDRRISHGKLTKRRVRPAKDNSTNSAMDVPINMCVEESEQRIK